jgi:hypothetical protein
MTLGLDMGPARNTANVPGAATSATADFEYMIGLLHSV